LLTHAPQQTTCTGCNDLLDDLIGATDEWEREGDAERAERRLSLFLRFELLDECREMAGQRRRGSVVLALEAFPNCRQPNASIASKNQPVPKGRLHPRSADSMGC